MQRYKHDMKAALNKRYIIFGMVGCLCFGIGDWLLGYVEPTLIGGDVFYFIRAGHGADYDMAKSVVTLILMIIGICFLYPGLLHISEIANDEKTKRQLKYACGLCSFGWLTLHMNVTLNVIAFSEADKIGGRELATTLSERLGSACMPITCGAFLLTAPALFLLAANIWRRKTFLRRSALFFIPAVPAAVIMLVAMLIPSSPFSYGFYTFCMNGGMLVWFGYLFAVNNLKG